MGLRCFVGEFAFLGQINVFLQEFQFKLVTVAQDRILIQNETVFSRLDMLSQLAFDAFLGFELRGPVQISHWILHLLRCL